MSIFSPVRSKQCGRLDVTVLNALSWRERLENWPNTAMIIPLYSCSTIQNPELYF